MQNFRALWLRPQTPVRPAAGGSASRPPKQPPPIANFWLRAWKYCQDNFFHFLSRLYLPADPSLSCEKIALFMTQPAYCDLWATKTFF